MSSAASSETPPQRRSSLVVIGGTGLGKSKLGVELALALNGEIVNADAMQCYRRFPIATARPTAQEQQGVPHHLFGTLEAPETVREYRDRALAAMEDIWSRNKLPIIVGGTLYYVQALVWRSLLDEHNPDVVVNTPAASAQSPSPPWLEDLDQVSDGPALHRRLAELDPKMAGRIHPNDVRKIKRSLEVTLSSGKPHSQLMPSAQDAQEQRFDCRILWLTCKTDIHEARLRARVEKMLDEGLLDEARDFEATEEAKEGKGIFQAMGLRELSPLIKDPADRILRERCVTDVVVHHRQYVQRQIKWIRNKVLPRACPVYALDTSDLKQWDTNVLVPALAVARVLQRSAGAALEEAAAVAALPPQANVHREVGPLESKTCETCEVVLIGDESWELHMRSKKHKSRLKRAKEGI